MTWFRLDDGWLDHPKMRAVGRDGRDLWVGAGTFCSQQLTDGIIPKSAVPLIAAKVEVARHKAAAALLVEHGLWIDHGDRFEMRAFLEYNPSAAAAHHKRAELSAKRAAAGRKGAQERWQTDSNRHGNPMANPMANAWQPDGPVPHRENGCTEAAACTTVANPAAADGKTDGKPDDEPPPVIAEAALLVAQRRRTAAQAATKANPAAWRAAAMTAIRAEVTEAAQSHATHVPHQPPHPGPTSPADGHTGHNAGKPAAGTITLDANALADLIEPPRPAAPSAPTRPEDATQRAAAALATKDRTCPRCHGSGNWLDDDGLAHECDHHP